jgi:hypothetical protein
MQGLLGFLIMTTARLPFGQKIVPIFSFFFVWAGRKKTEVFSREIKKWQTSPYKVGYFNYGLEKRP